MMTHSKELIPLFPSTNLDDDPTLVGRLEGGIERRSCGKIRDLRVVCEGGQIILSGTTQTYHAKQLALQAVLDLIDGHPPLANRIVVC